MSKNKSVRDPVQEDTVSCSDALSEKAGLQGNKEHVVFSFARMTGCRYYNFDYFTNTARTGEVADDIKKLMDELVEISRKTWEDFLKQNRDSGGENMPVAEMDISFINNIFPQPKKGETLISVRFGGKKHRLIIERGGKGHSNVAYVLGIDYDLRLYKHSHRKR